jgi:hypothetical protein
MAEVAEFSQCDGVMDRIASNFKWCCGDGEALALGARASRTLFAAVLSAPVSSMSQQERAGRPRSQG